MAMVNDTKHIWDAIVIGAGPAGGSAALQLARAGARVLLVERARFPREKVCGCCLNAAAIAQLDTLGLGDLPRRLGGRPTDRFRLHTRGHASTLAVPGGVALSRGALDQALVEAAISAGVTFQDATTAQLPPMTTDQLPANAAPVDREPSTGATRRIMLTQHGKTREHHARILLACTGLAGHLLDDEPGMKVTIAAGSLMGCAAIVDGQSDSYEAGIIHMALGPAGYVGLVRIEGDRLDVAAALRPDHVQQLGGPAAAIATLLRENHLPPLRDTATTWRGTPLLTRSRSNVAGHRLFVLGDAAAYVEPFTGEGIAWALASARAIVPVAMDAINHWHDTHISTWNRTHFACLGVRQRRCRRLTRALRMTRAVGWVNRLLHFAPALARPFVRAISRPDRFDAIHFSSRVTSSHPTSSRSAPALGMGASS